MNDCREQRLSLKKPRIIKAKYINTALYIGICPNLFKPW